MNYKELSPQQSLEMMEKLKTANRQMHSFKVERGMDTSRTDAEYQKILKHIAELKSQV
ncbi:hypothetical protein [Limnoraphis robusta]|uniref:50S ribosomal protein L29 n=1 Tax=Limnoraphis robusta CCNP1315 TaxID=3110306 RepID=A0ABU5U7N1_9CYAN|nr:hypothetical protein [Limnoraphis robusta]MEA5522876.1 hypothetical protein [Limnoraphis robusta CCNP1315]MEA5546862.1 hypothetical protein [Limnoraphis robusta CCNP1324]